MITFIIGLFILLFGYIFYSKYVESQFGITQELTPASKIADGVDFVPLSDNRNMLIHLLNIAGLGPILGAIQGILFGPIAFILIPTGCVFMGAVHDYFAGMLSARNGGVQITQLIKKFLGYHNYGIFLVVVSIMLLLLSSVFVFTAGDLIADRFFNQTDFSFYNPVVISIYIAIALYFVVATLFPIDKIIGRFYPLFGFLLLAGTAFVFIGFFTNGIQLQELDFSQLNQHPKKLALIPMFFMTVSCGLLSGFHSTQATIISRTIKTEHEGKKVFYGMMCLESLIAMIWAAGAMHVYSLNIVPQELVGTATVINNIADVFVYPALAFVVTIAVVVLPITSGDTALRGLRIMIAEAIESNQTSIKNRLSIIIPTIAAMAVLIFLAKTCEDSFAGIWRYFNVVNQLIAVPLFFLATVYLYKNKKNFWITLIPGIFYLFVILFYLFYYSGLCKEQMSIEGSIIYSVLITLYAVYALYDTNLKR